MLHLELAPQAGHLNLKLSHLGQELGDSILKHSPLIFGEVPFGLVVIPVLDCLLELAFMAIFFPQNLVMVSYIGSIDIKAFQRV